MSLQIAAQNLASKGRGPDTTLVHMSHGEVKSLNDIARAHGGSLTVNPHTGLPEAGFLSKFLPMIAGAALAATGVGAPMAALMVGGGYGVATGSLKKGLMAGLGAYGGAGLGAGLGAAGEAVGAEAAATAESNAAAEALKSQQQALIDKGAIGGGDLTLGNRFPPTGDAYTGLTQAPATAQPQFGPVPGTEAINQNVLNSPAFESSRLSAASQITPTASAPVPTEVPTGSGNGAWLGETSSMAPPPASSGPIANMGRGLSSLTDSTTTGSDAFMKSVGGGSGLLKYGMAAAAPALMATPQTAQYKGSGPNPYEYSYDYKTGQYTRQAPGYRDSITTSVPRAMAEGGYTYDPGTQSYSQTQGQGQSQANTGGGVLSRMAAYLGSQGGAGAGGYSYSYDPATQSYAQLSAPAPAQPDDVSGWSGGVGLAAGGMSDLGGYSDGGRMLRGPGDGVSDSIPATIGGKRPARLADGEFVVPARIVSELGNGSSEAGARKLYAMMDRVQGARKKSIGKNKVAVNSKADKMLPA